MNITKHTQAVLLLTAWFTKPANGDPQPLTPTEWGRFALWLKEQGILPEALLTGDVNRMLANWQDAKITAERIRHLLGRAGALGLALEKWERAGLWVMTRSDAGYPSRLKQRLKTGSPPVLFGCGNKSLLNQGGVAIIGSRDTTESDLAYTRELGRSVAMQGYSVVSGGARGVDEAAMLGALDHDGTAVGVLADSLLRAATSGKYRRALMANNLVLISPFNPEAGFNVGNAMARNKYIYCLADAAIVVATSRGKGGTWSGAMENLKERWVPLWVKSHPNKDSGNAALVCNGAHWLPEGALEVSALFENPPVSSVSKAPTLFAQVQDDAVNSELDIQPEAIASTGSSAEQELAVLEVDKFVPLPTSFYDYFLIRFKEVTHEGPLEPQVLGERFDLSKSQLNEWLKRAVEEGVAEKFLRPVRYQWRQPDAGQRSLFDEGESTGAN
ncbi:MAG: DNA-processing protein DprA [Gammaproteobacteria bacterium]